MTNKEKAQSIADQCKPCTEDFYSGIYQGVLLALEAEPAALHSYRNQPGGDQSDAIAKILKEEIGILRTGYKRDTAELCGLDIATKRLSELFAASQSLPQPDNNYWQLCPKCNGDGHLGRYNSPALSNTTTPVCDVCDGAKILATPQPTGGMQELMDKIKQRMDLFPDDPAPSERAAYDAYLNCLNWAEQIKNKL